MGALAGRQSELAALRDRLARAVAGDGGVVLIEGPLGIGKSRLLAELRQEVGPRVQVLTARSALLERDFAFGVARQLLPTVSFEAPTFATLDALHWRARDLADAAPVLLAVDDLQWADAASLRFLAYLANRLEGTRILLVATRRTGGAVPDVDVSGDVVTLGPLDADSVGAVLAERLGEVPTPALVDACATATGGNPLLVDRLAQALAEAGTADPQAVERIGPPAVARTVLARLAQLPDGADSVARAVAVLGSAATPDAVAALAGFAPADAARGLAAAEILAGDDVLAFVHPVVRDAVYGDLAALERAPLHARAAAVLHERAAPAPEVAAQLVAAGRTGESWAAATLREAARDADAEPAAAMLRAALAEGGGDRADLLVALGQAERGFAPAEGIAHLREGLAGLTDPARRAEAVVALAYALLLANRHEDVDRLLAEAGGDLGAAATDVRRQIEAVRLLGLHHGAGDPTGLADALAHRELPDRPELGELMLAGLASAVWSWAGGPAARVTDLAARTLADGRLLRAHNAGVAYGPVMALLDYDDPRGLDALRASFELATGTGTFQEVFAARTWYGAAMTRRGQLTEARQALADGREALGLAPAPAESRTYADALLVKAELAGGDLLAARRAFAAATRVDPRTDGMRLLDDAELELLAAEHDHQAVVAAAEAFEARHGGWLRSAVHGRRRALRGRALLALGDRDAGLAAIEEELTVARGAGAPGALGAALRDAGLAHGDPEVLADAVLATAGTPAVLEHVRSLVALGGALRRARRPRDAQEPLVEALRLASAGGVDGLAAAARAELAAMGARPRRTHLAGVAALTPSELRVATLAAEGVSNRDVAHRLYITPKTVEVHLSSVYRKLGIRSRKGLPAVLAEDTPVLRRDYGAKDRGRPTM